MKTIFIEPAHQYLCVSMLLSTSFQSCHDVIYCGRSKQITDYSNQPLRCFGDLGNKGICFKGHAIKL